MKLSSIVDFYLGIPRITTPYKIPHYLVPEIFQWCADNNLGGTIKTALTPEKNTHLEFIFSFEKLKFIVEPTDEKHQQMFKKFMHDNRYKFWKKRLRADSLWVFRAGEEKIHIISRQDAQTVITAFYNKVLWINNLVGTENWYIGDYSNLCQYVINGAYSYMNFLYFFDKEDKNLYKISDI